MTQLKPKSSGKPTKIYRRFFFFFSITFMCYESLAVCIMTFMCLGQQHADNFCFLVNVCMMEFCRDIFTSVLR